MAADLPEQKRLHSLLKRAAEELKAAQAAATAAQAELEQERTEHKKTRAALEWLEARVKALPADADGDRTRLLLPHDSGQPALTVAMDKLPPREERTAVEEVSGHQAELRARDAQELTQALAEKKRLQAALDERDARVREANGELGRLRDQLADDAGRAGELEAKLVSQDVELSSLREQLLVEQARGGDMRAKLQAFEDRIAQLSPQAGQDPQASERVRAYELEARVAELETLAAQAKTQLEAEHARVGLAAQRVAQLEGELAATRARRDELNVELAHVEANVKQARARVSEVEAQLATAQEDEAQRREALLSEHLRALADETRRRTEAEEEKLKERDRHQLTAQKLLEVRARVRELEGAVDASQGKVKELEAAATRREDEHNQLVARALDDHGRVADEYRMRLEELERQLEHATGEWRHVDRQYEQLHREMLVLLDQRDEARKELEALKQRFGLH